MKKVFVLIIVLISTQSYSQGPCSITKKVDKFEDEVKYSTRFNKLIRGLKYVEGEEVSFYLSLTCYGSTLNVREQGVKILLENGQKLNFPDIEIDVELSESGNYEYSAFIPLNDENVKVLAESRITNYKLYIYEWEPDRKVTEDFIIDLKCLITAK